METCIGMDLGGTKLLIGIVNGAGENLASRRYPSPLAGGAKQPEIAAYMLACVDDFRGAFPLEGVTHMGAGVVGRVDDGRGLWLEIEPGRCETVELARLLGERTGLPCRIDNAARCVPSACSAAGKAFATSSTSTSARASPQAS